MHRLYFIIFRVDCLHHLVYEALFSESSVFTTWYMKVHWVFFNTVNTAAIIVTLLYYGLLEVSKYFQARIQNVFFQREARGCGSKNFVSFCFSHIILQRE